MWGFVWSYPQSSAVFGGQTQMHLLRVFCRKPAHLPLPNSPSHRPEAPMSWDTETCFLSHTHKYTIMVIHSYLNKCVFTDGWTSAWCLHTDTCVCTHIHIWEIQKSIENIHTSRFKCADQDNSFLVQPMWSHRALQSEGPPLGLMIYCHAFEMFNTFEQMHTHVLSISFCLTLSSHLVFTLEVPTKLRCQPVRMKTAYCRRRGRLYLLYLESCLMMTSRWQHQAESSFISVWKGKKGRAGRRGRCIHPFPESFAISQSNRFSRFTHFFLLRLYFYPIHFFSFTFNIFLFFVSYNLQITNATHFVIITQDSDSVELLRRIWLFEIPGL